ncbi:MAG: hypothetical protein R3351_05685, partial [Nitrospirales bacterium]|nr:hypothetical protein [Nitrospirales bacterium]
VTPAHAFLSFGLCKFEEPKNGDLNLTDGSFVDMSGVLPAGSKFKFFGKEYGPSEIYVGSNGYVTFGQGDINWIESLDALCSIPRIAPLFDDFNPSAGGEVKAEYRKFPPRLIVTWDDVPEFGNFGSNTLQLILFLGTNKYHMSYNGLTAQDGLTGLCKGWPPPQSDISASSTVKGSVGVIYEEFNAGGKPFDLDGECLKGTPVPFENSTPVLRK